MAIQPAPRFANLMGVRVGGDLDGITYYVNKQGKVTFFAKAPPTCPPSPKQQTQRNRWRLMADYWHELTTEQRDAWERITKAASLCMTGYNLFIHIQLSDDVDALTTLERQTGVSIP